MNTKERHDFEQRFSHKYKQDELFHGHGYHNPYTGPYQTVPLRANLSAPTNLGRALDRVGSATDLHPSQMTTGHQVKHREVP